MKAVILAGGYGTRFSEMTQSIPKPLIDIGGRPIIWHIMKIYSYYGINEFIICLGYKGEMIKEYFYNLNVKDRDITIDYTNEGFKVINHSSKIEPWKITLIDTGLSTMTGGRLKRIEPYLDEDDEFLFTYGDGVSNVDIKKLIQFHKESKTLVTLTGVKPVARFGTMNLDGDKITEFKEKVVEESDWINGGFFVANKKIFDYIDDDSTVLEQYPLRQLALDGELSMYKHSGFWQSMDILKEKLELDEMWKKGQAPWKLWD